MVGIDISTVAMKAIYDITGFLESLFFTDSLEKFP